MSTVQYREADPSDIRAMARIRSEGEEGGASEERMARYLAREHHPQHALLPRVIYVAWEGNALVGYVAGHLTRHYACDSELQWIAGHSALRTRELQQAHDDPVASHHRAMQSGFSVNGLRINVRAMSA